MDDIGGRIEESKNWFERAAEHIPGYKGYKEKELRREADKLQRTYVAERLEDARRVLEELVLDISRQGDLKLLGIVDTENRKLRTIKDRVLYADYGYAGLFDTVKVDEDMLDQLYAFDAQMQEETRALEELINALSAGSPSLRSDLELLDQRLDAMAEHFSAREHLITGVGR